MKKIIFILLLIGLFAVEPYLGNLRVHEQLEGKAAPTATEFALQFLGEIRYTLAAYLWLKTEIYHHELGLAMSPGVVGSANARKVGEILSICRLVTRLDPHFIQAYDLGYWRLAKSLGKYDEAIAFLREGLEKNPESALLNDDMGQLYFLVLKDCGHAIPYIERASTLNQDKVGLSLDLRILGHCYERQNQSNKALQAYQRLLLLNPGDTPAQTGLARLKKQK